MLREAGEREIRGWQRSSESESGSGVRPSATRMRGPHSGLPKCAALLTAFKIRVGPFWNHPHNLSNISES
eukprot:scaffold10946_cov114-Isochrysis_galbana.AAC.1